MSVNDGASVLHRLPLTRWATRLKGGRVMVQGTLHRPLEVPLGAGLMTVRPGTVEVQFTFLGGEAAEICDATLTATGLGFADAQGTTLTAGEQGLLLDGTSIDVGDGPPRVARALHGITAALSDVAFDARATPVSELLVRLPAGVHVVVPATDTLQARGVSQGPPHALQLSEPLEVQAGGEGIRLSHRHFRWLARLARVRISAATLHPDGHVRLEGGASAGLDRAVRRGLRRTSSSLSSLVRTSPQFQGLRRFLKHGDER